jgi:hypothetical protein
MLQLTRRTQSIGALVLASLLLSTPSCGTSRSEPTVITADSRIETGFRDELGASFVLESVELRVDGRIVGRHVAAEDGGSGAIDFPAAILPAGEHEAEVHAVYRGEGHGIFSYLKEYKFDVESTHEFRTPPLGTVALTAVCFEKGGPTTELSDRPRIRWLEERR